MLRFVSYDVVFSEIPDEVTLAVNISNCPNRCPGCHSPYLWEDTGEALTEANLDILLRQYGKQVTCVCFMGGDAEPMAVAALARFTTAFGERMGRPLKTAWYSGCAALPANFPETDFHYIKLGEYVEALGGLRAPTTNQRLYRIESDGRRTDVTAWFWRKVSG